MYNGLLLPPNKFDKYDQYLQLLNFCLPCGDCTRHPTQTQQCYIIQHVIQWRHRLSMVHW